jgi:PAS domain-containing protein
MPLPIVDQPVAGAVARRLGVLRLMVSLGPWLFGAAPALAAEDDHDTELSTSAVDEPVAHTAATAKAGTARPARGAWLQGRVTDAETGEALPGVRIAVAGLAEAATRTDSHGKYALDVPLGAYELRALADLYRPRRLRIHLRGGTRLNLRLRTDPRAVEELVVEARADRRTEIAALQARKNSDTVQDAVSAQELARSPASGAADAVKHIVSATIVNGKYVFVRGLGGRYSTTLLNGVTLPSPDPDQPAVPLDIFPTGLLANLTVVKTYTPDLPGVFAGGVLRIESNSYPSEFEAKAKVGLGWDTQTTGRTRLTHAGGPTDWLSLNGDFRAIPNEVPKSGAVQVGIGGLDLPKVERIGEAFRNAWSMQPTTALPNLSLSGQVGDTVALGGGKLGYMLALNYGRKEVRETGDVAALRLEDGKLGVREQLRSNAGATTTALGGLTSLGLELNPNHSLRFLSLYTRSAEERTTQVAGFSESDNQDIDARRMQWVMRALSFSQLVGEHRFNRQFSLDWQGNLSRVWRDEPDTRDLLYHRMPDGSLRFRNGPGSGERFFSTLTDLSGGGGANLKLEFDRVDVALGGLVSHTDRNFEARRFRYSYVGKKPEVLLLEPEAMLSPTHIGPDFRLEERTLQADAYAARQRLWAGFGKLTLRATDALRLVGGVRYEAQSQVLSPGSPFSITEAAEPGVNRTAMHWLPAANLVYALAPTMNLRGGYSYTLARPQLRELAPFLFFDFARRRAVSGNPKLVDTRIHNADLRWEWFPNEREVVASSFFFKQFRDPIEAVIVNVAQGDVSYANAAAAQGLGLELEARFGLGRLTSALANLRAGANLTLVRSQVDLGNTAPSQTNQQRPLQGQSPYVVNFDLAWAAAKTFEVSAHYNVYGERLAEVGVQGLPDVYEQPFHRLDLAASLDLGRGLRLKFSAANLLMEAVVLRQGDVVVQRLPLGVTAGISLDWSP